MADQTRQSTPDDGLDVEAILRGIYEELDKRRRNRPVDAPPLWWPAIQIARRFEIRKGSSDDSRKKGVRLIMAEFAKRHDDFIASFNGYGLARDEADLKRYKQWLMQFGLKHVVHAHAVEHSQAMDDARGQLRLPTEAPEAESSASDEFVPYSLFGGGA